jgi:hypothetical protein
MTDADDWKQLQRSWQGDGPEARAKRHRLGARRAMLFDGLFAALWIGFAAFLAVRYPERWVLVWALTVALLSAMALAYSLWNRRDVLWPSAAAPLDFLAQSELRCTRQLELLRFMLQFGIAEVPIALALFWFANPRALPLAVSLLALVCGAGLLAYRGARRRALRELEEIGRLRRELEEVP